MALARQHGDSQWLGADPAAADLHDGGPVGVGDWLAQQGEDVAGEVALEGPQGFAARLAFLLFAREERLGARVDAALNDGDLVQRRVQAAVAVSVEPVAPLLAGGGVERRDARKSSELGVASEERMSDVLCVRPGRLWSCQSGSRSPKWILRPARGADQVWWRRHLRWERWMAR